MSRSARARGSARQRRARRRTKSYREDLTPGPWSTTPPSRGGFPLSLIRRSSAEFGPTFKLGLLAMFAMRSIERGRSARVRGEGFGRCLAMGHSRLVRCLFRAVAMLVALTFAAELRSEESLLWGRTGERWSPTSRLPDFSYAGYRRGEAPLP